MKQISRITLLAVLLSINSAFADGDNSIAPSETNELQVRRAISLLIHAGVLRIDGSKVVVENPSVLEQLKEQGLVDGEYAKSSSICAKALDNN